MRGGLLGLAVDDEQQGSPRARGTAVHAGAGQRERLARDELQRHGPVLELVRDVALEDEPLVALVAPLLTQHVRLVADPRPAVAADLGRLRCDAGRLGRRLQGVEGDLARWGRHGRALPRAASARTHVARAGMSCRRPAEEYSVWR